MAPTGHLPGMAGRVGEGSGNICPGTVVAILPRIMAPTPAGPRQALDLSVPNKWVDLSAL